MGSVFTSPVPPVALRACWTVTGNTNNALTAPSNLSPADTSAARRAADGRGRAGCALPRLHGKKAATSHSEVRGNGRGGLGADAGDSFARVSTYANTHFARPPALRLHVFYAWRMRAEKWRSGEALALVSLRERLIYETPSTVPLHNVPIRGSRHCGSVHHLAPATSTPGGVEIEGAGRAGWGGGGEDTAVHYLGISYRPALKPRPAASVYSRVDKKAKKRLKKKKKVLGR